MFDKQIIFIILPPPIARVAELVDALDSKSKFEITKKTLAEVVEW